MKRFGSYAVFAVALSLALTLNGAPQSERGLEKGKGHNKRRAVSYYDEGVGHGREDAANRRDRHYHLRPDRKEDRRDYERGYNEGYRAAMAGRGGERERERERDRGTIGGGSTGGRSSSSNPASQMGYQDGLADGKKDRATGHSFRPTEGDNYKHADRGYYSQLGSKDAYKQQYRQAYVPAYQQGYGR